MKSKIIFTILVVSTLFYSCVSQKTVAYFNGINAGSAEEINKSFQTNHEATIVNGDIIAKIGLLKQTSGNNLTLLGSGNILSQFAANGLIDEYLIMIDPVAIGSGIPIFSGIPHQLNLHLNSVHNFKSGVVLLNYTPKQDTNEE